MLEISLHILDILNNSITAGATRMSVRIEEDAAAAVLTVQVTDNGTGMTEEMLADVKNPFSTTRTTRKVGLGLSFLEEACRISGGHLTVTSDLGSGTGITATFAISSIDRVPLGNMGETLSGLISAYPNLDFVCRFVNRSGMEAGLDTAEMRELLVPVPLSEPEVYFFIRDYIAEKQENILGGI